MEINKSWHSWVIRRNKYENVIRFIRKEVPEIDKYFYPLVKKEYSTKKGTRVKDQPLYEGYLFVRYNDHNKVFHKLRQCPFVTTYAGTVRESEITRMQEAQGKFITELKTSRFRIGEIVVLLDGPFKDFDAKVIGIESDVIKVRIDAHLLGKPVEMIFQEDFIAHRPELKNDKVQDI